MLFPSRADPFDPVSYGHFKDRVPPVRIVQLSTNMRFPCAPTSSRARRNRNGVRARDAAPKARPYLRTIRAPSRAPCDKPSAAFNNGAMRLS
jgi:hypothetical protein